MSTCYEGGKLAVSVGADFIVAIGGGSPLDAAKAIAAYAANPAIAPEEIYTAALAPSLPIIAIPTTAGTGSEVNLYSVLTLDGKNVKKTFKSNYSYPRYALLDAKYMYSDPVRDGIAAGEITDCGSSLNVNSEKVVQVNPEAIFVLPYENGGYGKLENLPFPLVECADYMETSPLGCAEWMRFYGRLFGKAEESDSLFMHICSEYEHLREIANGSDVRPSLMCELKSSSAWYVPAGESTMGQLYKDAGADYLFSSYKGSGSVPLSYEVVLDKAADADIWLIKYNSPTDKSKSSLLDEFAGYGTFKPLKDGCIFGCNTHRNNIFENTSFHPERLLKELVAIFHPDLMTDYETEYYEKLR